jgi:beta-galactosidase
MVSAKLLPENNTYQEIEWKAVTSVGIESSIVKIDVTGNTATITALGDGEFRLRCTAKNGGKITQIISDLEFEVTGLGTITASPYEFMNASLYHISNTEYDNAMSGGINTIDNFSNMIGYKNLDFGDYGSDEVTLSIDYASNNPTPIEIWDGVPGETGSTLLLQTNYQAEWKWATFQPNTYKLPKRLKGLRTITFVFINKLNFEGFHFTYTEKAFEKLTIQEVNHIYGDSFKNTGDVIEHIGNNVSLEFDHMDFGDQGITKLVICGKPHADNTIHIHFENEIENTSIIVDFSRSDDFSEKVFLLDHVSGKQKVTFVFMPGCNFDFHWCQFTR